MTKDEALKLALEFVEANHSGGPDAFELITAIKQALAAPVQEPVAWMDGYRNIYSLEEKAAGCEDAVIPLVPAIQHWSDCAVHNEPAYTKGDCDCGGYTIPPAAQRQWVGTVDCIGLALDLEAQAKRVESQTVERAMLAAANGFRTIYKESNT
jgi:hypothetical protein